MEHIKDQIYPSERALYALNNARVEGCRFEGAEDGESALKESRGIEVLDCTFNLRYPLWHCRGFILEKSTMGETCRAPLWYSADGRIDGTDIVGVKALRECDRIEIVDTTAVSAEFGWHCRDIKAVNSRFESEYIFFGSRNIELDNIKLKGKYSFQYVDGLYIKNSELDTKDSFWHAKNVTVENSIVRGEYLGWYSELLTMRNCKIIGTQPFCYCNNLVLENCELVDCDLAFEYSDVNADAHGHIISIKNPLSGKITVDSVGEIIRGDAVYNCRGEVVVRKQK